MIDITIKYYDVQDGGGIDGKCCGIWDEVIMGVLLIRGGCPIWVWNLVAAGRGWGWWIIGGGPIIRGDGWWW